MATQRDHALKLGRALYHLQWLKRELGEWFQGDRHHTVSTVKTDLQFQGLYQFDTFVRAEKPPIDPVSLVIGECLHNMRSALDLLAYELAVAFAKPQPISQDVAEGSEFPIFGDEDRKGLAGQGARRFREARRKKIGGMDPRAQTVIEGLQPYQDGPKFRDHPLWRLHTLDRINKHRLLHTVVSFAENAGLSLNHSDNVSGGPPFPYPGVVDDQKETRVAGMVARAINPDREMVVVVKPTLSICFAPEVPDLGTAPVLDILADIYFYITDKVSPPLQAFL